MNIPWCHAATRAVGCSLQELTYLLHAMLARRLSRIGLKTNSISIKKKEIVLAEGREKGAREGRKEGRQEERNEGLSPKCCKGLSVYTCYFWSAARPRKFASVGYKMSQAPCSSQILAATCCKHHASMCNVQVVISTCRKYDATCSFALQKAAKLHPICNC